ncbi:hypothetical protein Syun_018925 [Stephania yunnanensis]|uniref:Uncharacterized protein n=2 Tax=Stephania yunnanensis TaxID=152371 RepID=A0AAP0IUS1_9MAGN
MCALDWISDPVSGHCLCHQPSDGTYATLAYLYDEPTNFGAVYASYGENTMRLLSCAPTLSLIITSTALQSIHIDATAVLNQTSASPNNETDMMLDLICFGVAKTS